MLCCLASHKCLETHGWVSGGRQAPQYTLYMSEGQGKAIMSRPDIHSALFVFSEEACLLPAWLPGAIHREHGFFCVKSDPLSIPRARHDLIKSCLPLVGAAVSRFPWKHIPDGPGQLTSCAPGTQCRPSWRAAPHSREMASLTTWAQGSVALLPILSASWAISHWFCRAGAGGRGPERGLAEYQSSWGDRLHGSSLHLQPCRNRCAMWTTDLGPAPLAARCQQAALRPLPFGRESACVLSLPQDQHLGCAAYSHLCLCTPHLVLPGVGAKMCLCVNLMQDFLAITLWFY